MKTNIIRVVMLVFTTFFGFLISARGQGTIPNFGAMPEELFIGNNERLSKGAVTAGPATVTLKIDYTLLNGGTDYEWSAINYLHFSSYGQFEDFLVVNGMNMVEKIKKKGKCAVNSDIILRVNLYYWKSNFDGTDDLDEVDEIDVYQSLLTTKSIGQLNSVTAASFRGLQMDVKQLVVFLAHLEELKIDVEGIDSYHWRKGERPIYFGEYPLVMIPIRVYDDGPDVLIIDNMYALAERRMRFEITAGGRKEIFTQHGARVTDGKLSISNSNKLKITIPVGSETIVEYSPSLQGPWVLKKQLNWDLGVSSMEIEFSKEGSVGFFRLKQPQ